MIIWLVVWNMIFMTVHSVGNGIIIPTDFHIFRKPPTSTALLCFTRIKWIWLLVDLVDRILLAKQTTTLTLKVQQTTHVFGR